MKIVNSKLLIAHKNIMHAFTTRLDGNSLYGNNLAYHVYDDIIDVDKNHYNLAKYLQYPLRQLVYMNQEHKDNIITIDKNYKFENIPSCDALITKEPGIPLMVMVADCIPVLIYDPIHKVIAVVHAGRAGIFSNILSNTINRMKNEYDCKAKDLIISLGPSIHQLCYEIGSEIKKEADNLGFKYAIKTIKNRHYLDLISIAQEQLKKLDIDKNNVEISKYCTACNTGIFYSYRAEKNKCGRFAGIIMLK